MFYHMPMFYDGWGFARICMQFVMLVGWGVLIGAAYMTVRNLLQRGKDVPAGGQHSTARDILDRRLAAGEISSQDYDNIRHTLGE